MHGQIHLVHLTANVLEVQNAEIGKLLNELFVCMLYKETQKTCANYFCHRYSFESFATDLLICLELNGVVDCFCMNCRLLVLLLLCVQLCTVSGSKIVHFLQFTVDVFQNFCVKCYI